MKNELSKLIVEAVKKIQIEDFSVSEIESSFEIPREEKFGDLSTHFVLKLAKKTKKAPKSLADQVCSGLETLLKNSSLNGAISKITVEGPGFINFYYSNQQIASVLPEIEKKRADFGKPSQVKPKKVLLEFVSANPTGPLTVAHGRQAALGDSLARILEFCGHRVFKEYYNNDEGVQIQTLGRSIRSRYLSEIGVSNDFPAEGYQGDYIRDIAKELVAEHGKKLQSESETFFSRYGRQTILQGIKKDLSDFGVEFDAYFSQENLMKSGKVEETLELLKAKGFVYEKEGAVWFESTRLGDDKDRVLIKSDKSYTYLTPDIAYHRDKFGRKFDFLIGILGPDHHGYIPRIKAAAEALGFSREALHILIAQLVTLYEGGQQVRMSTRAGEFITLREILDEVGKDAGRFLFLMRKFDAHLDFDLALAKSQTPENPVFYIQYAHARVESIKNTAKEKGAHFSGAADLSKLSDPSEIRLMRLLSQYGEAVAGAEKTLEPYRLVPYLMELAGAFHRFYTEHRVVTDDAALSHARMRLVECVQTVIRSGLGLLGVSAPLKM